jgi:hypothetical protein
LQNGRQHNFHAHWAVKQAIKIGPVLGQRFAGRNKTTQISVLVIGPSARTAAQNSCRYQAWRTMSRRHDKSIREGSCEHRQEKYRALLALDSPSIGPFSSSRGRLDIILAMRHKPSSDSVSRRQDSSKKDRGFSKRLTRNTSRQDSGDTLQASRANSLTGAKDGTRSTSVR